MLEVGGSHVTAAEVDLESGVVMAESSHTEPLNPKGSAEEILVAVLGCGQSLSRRQGESWAVAMPGPFDYRRGIGLFEGVGKFEALYGVDVKKELLGGLPGPPGSVTFVNDAEAFMWGEHLYGAAVGYARCVGITLGTGVGSAFFAEGAVCRSGTGVPPEGRVDLLEVDGRPLEDIVSTRALQREYYARTGKSVQGAAELGRLARSGDDVATAVLFGAFERLGAELRPWLENFGAEALVVGGAMARSWDLVGPALSAGLQGGRSGRLGGLVVSPAAHLMDAALLGAAAYIGSSRHGDFGGLCRAAAQ